MAQVELTAELQKDLTAEELEALVDSVTIGDLLAVDVTQPTT